MNREADGTVRFSYPIAAHPIDGAITYLRDGSRYYEVREVPESLVAVLAPALVTDPDRHLTCHPPGSVAARRHGLELHRGGTDEPA